MNYNPTYSSSIPQYQPPASSSSFSSRFSLWLKQLAQKYSVVIKDDVISALESNQIDEVSFLLLDKEALIEVGVAVGQRVSLMKILESEKNKASEANNNNHSARVEAGGHRTIVDTSNQNQNNNNYVMPAVMNTTSTTTNQHQNFLPPHSQQQQPQYNHHQPEQQYHQQQQQQYHHLHPPPPPQQQQDPSSSSSAMMMMYYQQNPITHQQVSSSMPTTMMMAPQQEGDMMNTGSFPSQDLQQHQQKEQQQQQHQKEQEQEEKPLYWCPYHECECHHKPEECSIRHCPEPQRKLLAKRFQMKFLRDSRKNDKDNSNTGTSGNDQTQLQQQVFHMEEGAPISVPVAATTTFQHKHHETVRRQRSSSNERASSLPKRHNDSYRGGGGGDGTHNNNNTKDSSKPPVYWCPYHECECRHKPEHCSIRHLPPDQMKAEAQRFRRKFLESYDHRDHRRGDTNKYPIATDGNRNDDDRLLQPQNQHRQHQPQQLRFPKMANGKPHPLGNGDYLRTLRSNPRIMKLLIDAVDSHESLSGSGGTISWVRAPPKELHQALVHEWKGVDPWNLSLHMCQMCGKYESKVTMAGTPKLFNDHATNDCTVYDHKTGMRRH